MPNDMPRVAIVSAGGYMSGKEIISLELANGLRDAGYHLELVVSLWTNGELLRRLQRLGHRYAQMRLGYISATLGRNEIRMTAHQLLYLPALWASYERFLDRSEPQKIIHTNWHHLLLLYPFLRPDRDLFWIHEVIPAKPRFRKLFSILSRRLCRFVAVSEFVRKSIIALGVPADFVTAIPNGVSAFEANTDSEIAPAIRIGIVGQIGRWKGHEDLCLAFGQLATICPQCELHIFGADTGDFVRHLRGLVDRENIRGRVHWHGFEPNREKIYSQIDICAVPSRFNEPFGLVAVEAALAALPVVATRTGGLPEIVDDGITGLLVEPENPESLSRALERLVRDPAARKEMGAAAKRRASELFGTRKFIDRFAALLEKC
jgi:glycosyltransferase involved in cell wall biosynthesis